MTLDELREAVAQGAVDTVLLAMTDMQGRLQGKRLTATHFLDEVVAHGAESCNYLLAVDVEMATVPGYAMSSWERGYGDFVMRPDLSTLRPVPWQEGTVICLVDVVWEDGSDVVASPRQILRRPRPLLLYDVQPRIPQRLRHAADVAAQHSDIIGRA